MTNTAMTNTTILVRIRWRVYESNGPCGPYLLGATRDLVGGARDKFWSDYYCPDGHTYHTGSAIVSSLLADHLVLQGKRSQYFLDGYAALKFLISHVRTSLTRVRPHRTDTYLACTLKGKNLIDYYEDQYCKKGGKYYEKPFDLSEFHAYKRDSSSDNVCMVPEKHGT